MPVQFCPLIDRENQFGVGVVVGVEDREILFGKLVLPRADELIAILHHLVHVFGLVCEGVGVPIAIDGVVEVQPSQQTP